MSNAEIRFDQFKWEIQHATTNFWFLSWNPTLAISVAHEILIRSNVTLEDFFLLNSEKKLPDGSIMNEGTVICASVLEITRCWDTRGAVTWLTATAAETMPLITQLLFTHMQSASSCRVVKAHAVKSNWLNVPRVISAVWTPGKTGLFALDQLSILNSSVPILQEEWVHRFYVPKNKSLDSRAPSLFFPSIYLYAVVPSAGKLPNVYTMQVHHLAWFPSLQDTRKWCNSVSHYILEMTWAIGNLKQWPESWEWQAASLKSIAKSDHSTPSENRLHNIYNQHLLPTGQ